MANAQVLVVEDESIVAKDIQNSLKRLGYAVPAIASSGEEAIQKAGETQPDLVLMDIKLKGEMDGVEAAEQIRARFNVPVVYVTAYADEDTLQRAKITEPFGYILKPFQERELHTTIEIALYKHKMEEALQASKASFHNIVERSADGIIVLDREGIVRYLNPAAEAVFGRKAEELLGELFGFPVVAGGVTELDIIRRAGEGGVAEMRVVETEWEGVSAYLALLRDVTERKRAEEALRELDRLKSEFIANTSHEFRTPLHSIRGFIKLMLDGKVSDPAKQKEFLSIVDKQSDHLNSLVDDLLDVFRMESGQMELKKQAVSMRDVIDKTVATLQNLAAEKGIAIRTRFANGLPDTEVDAQKLEQVVTNLINNAIKFSSEGSDIIVDGSAAKSELLVQVIDHGIGIPEEAIPHLFERFYRVDSSMTRSTGGSGLGLYISRQIVEAHGGQIWVKSKVDKGSTFSFTVPLAVVPAERTLQDARVN